MAVWIFKTRFWVWILLFCFEVANHIKVSCLIRDVSVFRYPVNERFGGTWSDWSVWSACSRTCGGGVRLRTRSCKVGRAPYRAPQRTCAGESIQYELCENKNCDTHGDFVAHQCSRHNGLYLAGKRIKEWIPHKGKNPCELQCRAKEEWVIHSFGKSVDGTNCALPHRNARGICVNGRCTIIDCSGQLSSDNGRDMCGICRGDNSTCVPYENTFWSRPRHTSLAFSGYQNNYDEIAVIPSGATHILVRENSINNFLVLRDQAGAHHINSNWRIHNSGVYSINGVEFVYNRSSDGYEQLSAEGPTLANIFIFVFGTGNMPTIHYKYWLPKDSTRHITKQHLHPSSQTEAPKVYLQTDHDVRELNTSVHKPLSRKSDGYRSYYHRNEILRSVPSWSIKRHRYTHGNSNQNYSIKQHTAIASISTETPISNKIHHHGSQKKEAMSKIIYAKPGKTTESIRKRIQKFEKSSVDEYGRPNVSLAQSQGRRGTIVYSSDDKRFEADKRVKHGILYKADEEMSAVISPSKLATKEKKNERKKRKGKTSEDDCGPCTKVKQQKKNFCTSEFVLRASVLASEAYQDSLRYELQVTQSFRNTVHISNREFVWTPNRCRCPKLRIGTEYILMGRSGLADRQSRESRLLVDGNSFVRRYNQKRARAMQKLVRDQERVCKKFR